LNSIDLVGLEKVDALQTTELLGLT